MAKAGLAAMLESMSLRELAQTVVKSALGEAILQTVAYGDLFDFPLTAVEIHRYLHEHSASFDQVQAKLPTLHARLRHQTGYYFLPQREELVTIRQERTTLAQRLWPEAVRYGRFLTHLPFVRMVAVTGSLAVGNPDCDADIDYLVVTENGRLWLCRAFTILLVRLAARRGLTLCPNYLISENALQFPERNLYVAHELAQMVPLSGHNIYQQMRQQNRWTATYLPNAPAAPPIMKAIDMGKRPFWQQTLETTLRSPFANRLEAWEMTRKIRKFQQTAVHFNEADLSPTRCKGHFEGHQQQTLNAYTAQMRKMDKGKLKIRD